uniref:Uncharacterized protein n=1 Tax=Ditylenchus dipsaci TaxID=166011 RepID=A0A915D9A6_9BILA
MTQNYEKQRPMTKILFTAESSGCLDQSQTPSELHVSMSKRTAEEWFRKYFFEGQKLEGMAVAEAMAIPPGAGFDQKILIKYRKFIAFLIPFLWHSLFGGAQP